MITAGALFNRLGPASCGNRPEHPAKSKSEPQPAFLKFVSAIAAILDARLR